MTIYIIRLKPNKEAKVSPEEKKKAGKIHHDFVEELVTKNIIVFGGPVVNAPEFAQGMIVANLPSADDVMETFKEDPMISLGLVNIEITEWDIQHNPNNFNKLL